MSTYTFGAASVDVSIGHETIAVDGYEDGYRIHTMRYSGYTLSEAICAALIAMSLANSWLEAIDLIESAGIRYRPSE